MNAEELLQRGVTNVTPRDLAEKKLASGQTLRLYLGIDPTGTQLHLGHSVVLRKLRAFQDAGHDIILVIGSFTAMIGDPTGRDAMREVLTKEQVQQNFESYKEQAAKILDFSKVQLRYNHEWLETLSFADIIDLASKFTVQQMIDRDMFQKRLKEGSPISLHEFFYPLMVGYDSVVLDVDCELGGNDQYFNMLAGRTLQTALGKRDKFVLTTKLIEGTDGRKMSKSYQNCIFLTDEANDMFGKIMSIKDDLMPIYFECCTDVPLSEIDSILKEDPRSAKIRLAREIVTLYHSSTAADAAEAEFTAVFTNKELPSDIPTHSVTKGTLLIDALIDAGLIESKSAGRRLIEQNGIKLNDNVVADIEAPTENGIVKVGKRKFVELQVS